MNLTTWIGLALIVIGIAWRTLVARRVTARHADALRSTDPAVRAAAVRMAVTSGLDRTADLLNAHLDGERDETVLDALAHSVALRQWEPSDRASVTRIREWSASHLIERGGAVRRFGPAVTRLADMGGPQRTFRGNPGITGDRTLDATIAEIRALCARIGVDHASLDVREHRITLALASDDREAIPADVAARLVAHEGASGELGSYAISIDHRSAGPADD